MIASFNIELVPYGLRGGNVPDLFVDFDTIKIVCLLTFLSSFRLLSFLLYFLTLPYSFTS